MYTPGGRVGSRRVQELRKLAGRVGSGRATLVVESKLDHAFGLQTPITAKCSMRS